MFQKPIDFVTVLDISLRKGFSSVYLDLDGQGIQYNCIALANRLWSPLWRRI